MSLVGEYRKIVFEKLKCPYYMSQRGNVKTALALCRNGLDTYIIQNDSMILRSTKPWSEITEEDCEIFLEKCGLDIDKPKGGSNQ